LADPAELEDACALDWQYDFRALTKSKAQRETRTMKVDFMGHIELPGEDA
jgi:hypothetical protein